MFVSLHTATMTTDRVQKAGVLDRVARFMRLGHAAWRQRQQLACLDAAALRDIGVDPRDAAVEARRPIWDVPASWRN